jgi:hypothetical protein
VRTQLALSLILAAAACVNTPPIGGPVGEGAADYPNVMAVDSAYPPKSATVRLDKDAFTVVLLVAPGHSATLLYPKDSTTDNRLAAGTHNIAFEVPGPLVRSDSAASRRAQMSRAQYDSAYRQRMRTTMSTNNMPPLMPGATTYLLVVTSPHQLTYGRVIDRTAGWSIPLDDMEALNSVAKQVKSTIAKEPRDWSAAYHLVVLTKPGK